MTDVFEESQRKQREFAKLLGQPARFSVGARVRLARTGDTGIKQGYRGTVLDESVAPWVRFDRPVGNAEGDDNVDDVPGWEPGHMACIRESHLAPL